MQFSLCVYIENGSFIVKRMDCLRLCRLLLRLCCDGVVVAKAHDYRDTGEKCRDNNE